MLKDSIPRKIYFNMCTPHHITTLTTQRSEYLAWPAAHCAKSRATSCKQGDIRTSPSLDDIRKAAIL